LARPDDLEDLREIERLAGEAFREVGMVAIADDALPTVEELAGYQRAGRAWVAIDAADKPIAYVLVELLDGAAHVEQISVDPRHARKRVGKKLLDTVARWAYESGLDVLTLTTFTDVPWNAPYYERLGWSVIESSDLTAGLAKRREEEAARGLDRWPRAAMQFVLNDELLEASPER
jgi:GNAT superfamily N-acetyltransferase